MKIVLNCDVIIVTKRKTNSHVKVKTFNESLLFHVHVDTLKHNSHVQLNAFPFEGKSFFSNFQNHSNSILIFTSFKRKNHRILNKIMRVKTWIADSKSMVVKAYIENSLFTVLLHNFLGSILNIFAVGCLIIHIFPINIYCHLSNISALILG